MNTVEALSCQELVELVTDYERARFESHLSECGSCEEYLDQIRATAELAGTLTLESLSPEAERTLLDAFRDWKRG
jgi:hypothetical protein